MCKNTLWKRVHRVVVHLQPVAWHVEQIGDHFVAGQLECVADRKLGLKLRRTHIGEHDALVFEGRVGAMTKRVADWAVIGLARRLQDRTVDVEQPAMITAADAMFGDDAVFE